MLCEWAPRMSRRAYSTSTSTPTPRRKSANNIIDVITVCVIIRTYIFSNLLPTIGRVHVRPIACTADYRAIPLSSNRIINALFLAVPRSVRVQCQKAGRRGFRKKYRPRERSTRPAGPRRTAIGVKPKRGRGRNCEINNVDIDDTTLPVYRVVTVGGNYIHKRVSRQLVRSFIFESHNGNLVTPWSL